MVDSVEAHSNIFALGGIQTHDSMTRTSNVHVLFVRSAYTVTEDVAPPKPQNGFSIKFYSLQSGRRHPSVPE